MSRQCLDGQRFKDGKKLIALVEKKMTRNQLAAVRRKWKIWNTRSPGELEKMRELIYPVRPFSDRMAARSANEKIKELIDTTLVFGDSGKSGTTACAANE